MDSPTHEYPRFSLSSFVLIPLGGTTELSVREVDLVIAGVAAGMAMLLLGWLLFRKRRPPSLGHSVKGSAMWNRVIALLLLKSLIGPWSLYAAPADSAFARLRALEGDWLVRTPESTWSYVFISASNGGPVVSYCPTLSGSRSTDQLPRLYNQFGRSTDLVVRICCSSGGTILRDLGRFCADTNTILWWRDTGGSFPSPAAAVAPVGKWVIRGNSLMHWYVSTSCARSALYYTITNEWLLSAVLCRRLAKAAPETNTTYIPIFWQAPRRALEDEEADVLDKDIVSNVVRELAITVDETRRALGSAQPKTSERLHTH